MGVSEEIRQKLLPRFRETTADRVEKISNALLELERGGATPEVSEELARELHTLKGEARMMGFVGISSVVHAAEDFLKALSAEQGGERLDALLKACDAILPMLDSSADGGGAAAKLSAALRELIAGAPPPAAAPAAPPNVRAPPAPGAEKGSVTAEHEVVRVEPAQAQYGLLAERIGNARLIPLSGVLGGFPRAARDMAREQGKEVECIVRGAETGVDKAILLSLNDPLVHLVRNSVDHGIEEPEERAAAGKPRIGKIVLSARTDGDLLAITVEDDGGGISPQKVRAAALKKGIIGEQQAASLSARAALDLIFTPGFSTRDQAGETSGRGVGLDVVRKRVTGLGGSVAVESEPRKGAKFTLRMPQSLSIMKVLLVRIDDDVYGIPAVDVDSVGRLEPKDITEVAGIRAVRYRGRLMPVVALGPLLSLNGGPRTKRPLVAHVVHGSEGAAVVVDGLFGEREVAVKAPGAFLKGMRFVTGAAALEDGRVALLLSTSDIVLAARRLAAPAMSRGRERKRLRILLGDNSAIAREAAAALLRSLGHEVDQAVDGEDGWQKLQSGAYTLLVTDVQMPVLDGIDLTRRVKATPRFVKLPIVILSSLSAPEERRRGVDAGADAYLVKGELEADSFAATLERLTGVGA